MNSMDFQDYDVILHVFEAIEKKKIDEVRECFTWNFKSVILNEEVTLPNTLTFMIELKKACLMRNLPLLT
jgi:ketosteroid isomerase-like protein